MNPQSSMNRAQSPATSAVALRPRILVADDSRVMRLAIFKILGTAFDVVQVDDGARAWERLSQDAEIQALITDIEMPELDGYALISRLRAADDSRLRKLPVITITGADDEATKQRAFDCGATDFITKPIDAIQLQARVQAYVRYDQTARELSERSTTLEGQVITDPVTGLRSRRYLVQRGEQDVAFALRRGKDVTLIRIAIDGFKKLYQAHGDETGDGLLVWLAKLLSGNARIEDTAVRVAGAEFAILANATRIQDALVICDRLRAAVADRPYCRDDATIPITLSFGLASLGQDRRNSIHALLALAQERLRQAQAEGGDRLCRSTLPKTADSANAAEPAAVEQGVAMPVAVIEAATDMLSVTELEDRVREQAGQGATDPQVPDAFDPGPKQLPVPFEPMTVDQALQHLAQGERETLALHVDALMQRLQPLIDFCLEVRRARAGGAG